MAENILKLRVDSQEYDNKLKRASDGLQRYIEGCRKAGGTLEHLDDGVEDFTKSLGSMGTAASGAKGKLSEMTKTFTDLSMEYKHLTDQEKAAPFGKALSASLDQLQGRIQQTKADLNDINSKLSGAMPEAGGGGLFGGDKFSGMLQVFGGNLMTKGAGMALSFVSEMGDMVKQGIELAKAGEGVRLAFERLNQPGLLSNLREATHGTVTDLELMKAAVQFNDFKLPVEELGTMLAFAQQKAKDTGQSVEYMTQSIVTGLGRKSLMILDNLGLSASEIKEKMKETGDMTKAVGEIIREQMAKAGDYVETAADRATQANVSLQNKMEELGRKFGPLEQASSNLWTSIKIGIMDIVGGPLTEFINKLTEAGRLAQQYGVLGGSGKVGRMINNLSGAREDNRQSVYQQQQEQFWRYINPREQQIRDIQAWQRGERGEALQKRVSAITDKYGSLDATKIQAEVDAARKMLAEYQQSAKQILNPVSDTKPLPVEIKNPVGGGSGTTTGTTPQQQATKRAADAQHAYDQAMELAAIQIKNGTITEAEAKKKELQAREQLWKALCDAYNTYADPNIKKTQDECASEMKKLGGEVKDSVELEKRAQENARNLERAQKRLIDAKNRQAAAEQMGSYKEMVTAKKQVATATNELKNIEITADVAQAMQNMRLINAAVLQPKTFTITADDQQALDKIKAVDGATLDEKTMTVIVDSAEATAQLKAIDNIKLEPKTFRVSADIDKMNLPTATNPTEQGGVQVPIKYTSENLDAFVGELKDNLSKADIGSKLYNDLSAQLADANALGNLIQTAIKNGIDVAEFNPQELWSKVFGDNPGDYISDETWENIRKKIEEIIGKPIKLNLKTGETTSGGRSPQKNNPYLKTREDGKTEASISGVLGGLGSGMSQMVNGIEQLGIDVPEGIKNAINAMQGISTILTGIATTVLAIEAIAGADAIIPFARGGMIKAFSGTLVGTTYSGDQLRGIDQSGQLYGLNAGEVVLNRAQVGNLASQLSGGMAAMQLSAIITGEQLRLVLNNNGRRTGRGEYVTTKFR